MNTHTLCPWNGQQIGTTGQGPVVPGQRRDCAERLRNKPEGSRGEPRVLGPGRSKVMGKGFLPKTPTCFLSHEPPTLHGSSTSEQLTDGRTEVDHF